MKLTVLYDGECGFCRRCRDWLRAQEALIPIEFLALQAPEVERRYPGIGRFQPERALIVIDDRGGVYQGERAWMMCLFALRKYRWMARGWSNPALMPLSRAVCRLVSSNRRRISLWMGMECEGGCHV